MLFLFKLKGKKNAFCLLYYLHEAIFVTFQM